MHRHRWVVKSTVRMESAWEKLNKDLHVTSMKHAPPSLFVEPMIVTYWCEGCGSEKVERV